MIKKVILILFAPVFLFFTCQPTEQNDQKKEAVSAETKKENTKVMKKETSDLSQYGISKESHNAVNPLEVGSMAPAFSAKDQNKKDVDLDMLTANGSAVLVFYRGFWCPYCTRHLATFADKLKELQDAGTQVVAIAPEGPDGIQKSIDKTKLNIPFISDPNGEIMNKYGVGFKVNDMYQEKFKNFKGTTLEEVNGQTEPMLPVPATYVIGKDKKVKWVHFDPNYRERSAIDEIVKAL